MPSQRDLAAENAALLQRVFDMELAEAERPATARTAAVDAANAKDATARAAASAEAIEKVRVGAWTLWSLEKQVSEGNGREPFVATPPPQGWPPGQSAESYGFVASTARYQPDDISDSPIMKRIAARRGGKL